MKKFICIFVSFMILSGIFSGCTVQLHTNNNLKIGLAAPDATHGWVAGVAYYAEKYCNENNLEYQLTISANADEMEDNIESLCAWGMQVLVVWPQWSGMEDAIDAVLEKGIPVVSFDVDIASNGICKVSGNNYDMGYQSAKYICDTVGEAASIAVLNVPSASSVSEKRLDGFYDYLEEINYDTSYVFEINEESFSRECGYDDMQEILNTHEKVDAVFSLDDEVSIGVVQAITEAGRTDIKAITGGGGMQEYFRMIADESYAHLGLASALYSPSMIEDAIDIAIDLASGKNADRIVIIPTKIISSDTVSEYIDNKNTVY